MNIKDKVKSYGRKLKEFGDEPLGDKVVRNVEAFGDSMEKQDYREALVRRMTKAMPDMAMMALAPEMGPLKIAAMEGGPMMELAGPAYKASIEKMGHVLAKKHPALKFIGLQPGEKMGLDQLQFVFEKNGERVGNFISKADPVEFAKKLAHNLVRYKKRLTD